jgi:hypothetical protein
MTVTEAEWLACSDLSAMLEWLHKSGEVNRRKLGLFFAACCRRIQLSRAEKWNRRTEYIHWDYNAYDPIALTDAPFHLFCAVRVAIHSIMKWEHSALGAILRDIVGPLPFRPVAIEPSCRTPYVFVIAKGIYEDRAFYRLPSLADALEEAGCTDADIIGHLRGPGPHLRGCWVVDLCLGKS